MTPVIWIIIAAVSAVIALLAGYFIGNKAGGGGADRSDEIAKHKQAHDDFRGDVREHFQQTAAIMSRMAEDYRDMHQHMSQGAERLADMDREKLAAPANPQSLGHADGAKKAETDPNQLGSAMDAKVNGGKPSETPGQQPSDAAVKSQPKK
tara:strand:+ start:62 stop:514 length:453 start_codon:yes stop_codon:yes gene_type:complete